MFPHGGPGQGIGRKGKRHGAQQGALVGKRAGSGPVGSGQLAGGTVMRWRPFHAGVRHRISGLKYGLDHQQWKRLACMGAPANRRRGYDRDYLPPHSGCRFQWGRQFPLDGWVPIRFQRLGTEGSGPQLSTALKFSSKRNTDNPRKCQTTTMGATTMEGREGTEAAVLAGLLSSREPFQCVPIEIGQRIYAGGLRRSAF